ncbi:Cleavage polyadenylation factor subunit clp1 [Coemansia sp. RSA 1722]|nr:Cleavage polyadenylation factor subunit clp1 [Coemansia sp. RSA 1722]
MFEWKLAAGQEFRFEVSAKTTITIKLKTGFAEYFGAELGRDAQYSFSGTNGAIYTWQGCVLTITGECQSAYVAEETPMSSYINVHMGLQQLRVQAHGEKDSEAAPRVMVVGPEDCGKTSICKILLNYAVRMEESPVFVNLDPAEATVAVPGTISATCIGRTVDIEEGFAGSVAMAGGAADQPLVLQYGHLDPTQNPVLFNQLVDRLADSVSRRMAADTQAKAAGLVVDTHGSTDLSRLGFLEHAITSLRINTLVVVGNERMYSHFTSRINPQTTAVLKLAKSGGTVDRDANFRHHEQAHAIGRYFAGTQAEPRMSFSTVVNFADTRVVRVGEDAKPPSSTLPLGETRKLTDTSVVDVDLDEGLFHSVLAVTDVPISVDNDNNDVAPDVVVGAAVLGFVNVTKVDMDKRRLTVTSPVPGRLPTNLLLYSDVKWMEI